MDRFVHDQNLRRFVDLLEREPDGPRRTVLQELLIEEENRFGERQERLEQAEVLIVRGRERIRRQVELVARLSDGDGADMAKATLRNLMHTQSLFEAFREVMMNGHAPGALG